MGYRTPNFDRIGREGAMFTDWYGQQSCAAGRAAFLTGQSPIRTGLTKVGLPGAKEGLSCERTRSSGAPKASTTSTEYPPRMTPASFNLEKVMAEVQRPASKN